MSKLYKKILVAVDESHASEKAFVKAVELAKQYEVEKLIIAHVIDTRAYSMYDHYNESVPREYAHRLLDGYVKRAHSLGCKNVKKIMKLGSPKIVVSKDIALEQSADLIVCGATGMSALDRIFLGSVSDNTVRHAICDVLIVRNPEE